MQDIKKIEVARELNQDHCEFASLRTILKKLELELMVGQRVRLDQGARVVVFERTVDGWDEMGSVYPEREYSTEKGWND